MARIEGLPHWTNTREGHKPSKTRFGPSHEVKAGAHAHGKKLRNRQQRRRERRWLKPQIYTSVGV